MAKLVWDASGTRQFEAGVDRGVLYPLGTTGYEAGVAWSGLTAVNEAPSGAESNPQYADNIKYVDIQSAEEFNATIEALTYPDEFELCDGSASPSVGLTVGQQTRKPFAFCYRSLLGNDLEQLDAGYKIHLVYGAKAAPSEKSRTTINDSPEAMPFSWEISTTPVPVTGYKPSAHLTLDSTKVPEAKMAAIEALLYGTEALAAELPTPDEVIALLGAA